jgi:uncharacterized protein YprB with RNaseH-like and TPR domain
MLTSTFLHIPGVGRRTESRLWSAGIVHWDLFPAAQTPSIVRGKGRWIAANLEESRRSLQAGDPGYFARGLPLSELWRLFAEFRDGAAYLDIETTGGNGWDHHITTIALFDGRSIRHYVYGENLDDFEVDVRRYRLLITYNGRCFDLPFIRNNLGVDLPQAHIDLRFLLHGLGYRGGLKGCERQLGIDRGALDGLDGFCAVLLWEDYIRNGNPPALETLLAYNAQDVINLETLMVHAYNLKLQTTPFAETDRLPLPNRPDGLFEPDRDTVERIKSKRLLYRDRPVHLSSAGEEFEKQEVQNGER